MTARLKASVGNKEIMRMNVVGLILFISAVTLAGCVRTGPKEEEKAPHFRSPLEQLKYFMETQPDEKQLMTRIESMKLPQPMVWVQGSPYTYSYWKLPSGGGITIFGWGPVTTRAELKDAHGKVISSLVYKTQQEAEAKLQQYLKSRKKE